MLLYHSSTWSIQLSCLLAVGLPNLGHGCMCFVQDLARMMKGLVLFNGYTIKTIYPEYCALYSVQADGQYVPV